MLDPAALRLRLHTLLAQRSLARGEFVLASGRRSSYYIDARRTTLSAEGLAIVGHLGLALLAERAWDPRAVGGLTMGADPVAAAIAAASAWRGRPINAFTVRRETKGHGLGRRIEGCFTPGDAVVIVEDVITTGGSAREAITAVEAEGGKVLGVLAVVDREEGGRESLERAGYAVAAMITARELLEAP